MINIFEMFYFILDVNVDLNAEQKVSEEHTSQEVMQETEEKQSKSVTG